MLAALLFLILFTPIALLVVFESRQFKTPFSPFTLLAVPYLVILIYQIIVVTIYDWQALSSEYLFLIFIFLVSFFIVGQISVKFLQILYRKYPDSNKNRPELPKLSRRYKTIEYISLLSAGYLLLVFLLKSAGLSSLGEVVQEDFQNAYSSGINFHLRLICMIGTVYFWGLSTKNNKKFIFLGLLCFLPNFLTFVKGVSYLLFLGSILANLLINNKKLKFKKIVSVFAFVVAMFFCVYLIEIGIWDTNLLFVKETYELIYAKFNLYLIAGVQSFNVNLSSSQDSFASTLNPVYAPVVNILSKIGVTERVETINNIWVNLGYIPYYGPVNVNTNTYIGTLVLYCGTVKGLVVSSTIAVINYYFFFVARRTKDTFMIVRYSILVSGLILGWFEYYYWHMFWVYLIIFFFVLKFVSKYKVAR